MTESEKFDAIFDRIQLAMAREAFVNWPEYRLRILSAERSLGLGYLVVAEDSIAKAEKLLLGDEIRQMALRGPRDKIPEVIKLLEQGQLDEALQLVLA